jgi:hypothetical protein
MTCYGVGTNVTTPLESDGAAGLPSGIPPDQTNM